jgi:putative oxidoreductase
VERYQAQLALMGRVLLCTTVLWAALFNIMNWSAQVAVVAADHAPMPELMLGLATGIEIVFGLPLLVGYKSRWCALILGAYIFVCAIILHQFWSAPAAEQANQMLHFFEGIGVAGGLLVMAAFGPGAISMDERKAGS